MSAVSDVVVAVKRRKSLLEVEVGVEGGLALTGFEAVGLSGLGRGSVRDEVVDAIESE